MLTATVTSKGQITIPKEVRELLRLHSGDSVQFVIQPDGNVILLTATLDAKELRGFLRRKSAKLVTIEQMNVSIKRRLERFK